MSLNILDMADMIDETETVNINTGAPKLNPTASSFVPRTSVGSSSHETQGTPPRMSQDLGQPWTVGADASWHGAPASWNASQPWGYAMVGGQYDHHMSMTSPYYYGRSSPTTEDASPFAAYSYTPPRRAVQGLYYGR
mmetsp:Transcript_23098/g.46211  ORF Transcript_23098/g.46211 Transcript_23098/m.46211 type:complete len:137 (-) Transcript_23098:310-720(-)|eukprot:CAMPEP_0174695324 /NCGR_PEP_ID=MMETSP1094-20130205/1716_1 /TAXON_ID=156173 /ORGANISM="Chrysochromulina brevifilum, Strain UTEX LB 985" /LENGTH=136 /DNA_ID=CAMNT_0015891789 /DNA_START=67 /DNA_END=477 /DNA_ORIENTATION=-